MKILAQTDKELIAGESFTLHYVVAVIMLLTGIGLSISGFKGIITTSGTTMAGVAMSLFGLILLLLLKSKRLTLNKANRQLTFSIRGLVAQKRLQLSFDKISKVRLDSKLVRSRKGLNDADRFTDLSLELTDGNAIKLSNIVENNLSGNSAPVFEKSQNFLTGKLVAAYLSVPFEASAPANGFLVPKAATSTSSVSGDQPKA